MPEKINVMNPLQIYQNMYTKEFFLVILFLSTKILGQGGILLYETIMCLDTATSVTSLFTESQK